MAKRVVYQIDPKRRKPDGSFPDFVFNSKSIKYNQKKWLFEVYLTKCYNAAKKKIPFALSFAYFLNFCRNTGYHILRGPHRDEMTIDRIDNLKGYTDDNIQMLSSIENYRKYWEHDIKRGKRGTG